MARSPREPLAGAAASAGIEVRVLQADDEAAGVERFLATAEEDVGGPVVDESEEERLRALLHGERRSASWRSALLYSEGHEVAYTAIVLPYAARSAVATGDIVVRRRLRDPATVTAAALRAARGLVSGTDVRALQLWIRSVGPAELDGIEVAAGTLERELLVLARSLPAVDATGREALEELWASGGRIRSYVPDRDDVAVVAVLAEAYEGTDDGGWDLDRLAARRRYAWFDPEDLLLAEDADGRVLGLHWLKPRGGGEGEVYNLAVRPGAQGRRLGPALLQAGLDHLADLGCDRVVLWVDAANVRAVRLYQRHGFSVRSTDVAVGLDVDPG
ncbi:MAG: GNAT family N-acetyltransferase [Nitriliruptoraceae bacterium]